MAGNEKKVVEFLFSRRKLLRLPKIGVVKTISIPTKNGIIELKSEKDVDSLSTEDSRKKSDIYINGRGVSIKQIGGSFSFNRLQRANIIDLFNKLGFGNISGKLKLLDNIVNQMHEGKLDKRNRLWQDFFSEEDFRVLLEFLMMKGSPNVGKSEHEAEFILEAPAYRINDSNIHLFTFSEYFELYKNKIKIAIRRQWIGQASNSEHKRALGFAKKEGNSDWIFSSVSGKPRTGWRSDIHPKSRKTVYLLMIEKEG